MSLQRLTIHGVRNLEALTLEPAGGINWLTGPNGAGKTSVLEAIHLLARGRSFRTHRIASVIQHGERQLSVVAHPAASNGTLGVERSPEGWRGRIDGRDSHRISDFARRLPLVLIEPDSHRLIDGGPDQRRRYLDWLLFHVEHDYLHHWRRYARQLRQRNAALKSGAADDVLDALDGPLAAAAETLNRAREAQVAVLETRVRELAGTLGFRLPGEIELACRPGHPSGRTLAEALAAGREQDREQGFTRAGPHRAEMVLRCGGRPAAAELSRGQQKLLAVLLLLAQLSQVSTSAASAPLLLLDDPVSELDEGHLAALLAWLRKRDLQSWITATTPAPVPAQVFHVEQGKVHAVI